jgi:hypothetical protein
VPESEAVNVGLEALELTMMLPLALAADDGVNIALKVTLAPGFSESGRFSPLMLKPVPEAEACEIVTLAPPVLVNESIKVRVLPTWTFPKFRLLGLAVSCPGPVPVPARETAAI